MQHPKPYPKSRAVIKAAIECAGGYEAVAKHFGLTLPAIHAWRSRGTMPAHYVRPLCELGGGVVSVESLLDAIERTAADKVAA